jgi:hypothetical protein
VQYVLADSSAQIAGQKVAEDADRQMAVYRVNGLLRTATSVTGWYGDTWTSTRVVWSRPRCDGGQLRVPVHTSAGPAQTIAVSGTTTPFSVRVSDAAPQTIVVPLQPRSGRCRVRFDISPPRHGVNDPRTLGVLASGFQYLPSAG